MTEDALQESQAQLGDMLRPGGPVALGRVPHGCVMRFFREGDEDRLQELLTEAFPRWPPVGGSVSPAAYLHWKLRSRPEAVRYHVVAELDSRIIACRLFLLQRVKVGNRLLEARQGVDTAVHPAYQGRGLMTALTYPVPERLWEDFDIDFSVRSGTTALNRMRQYDARQNRYARVGVLRLERAAMREFPDEASAVSWSIATLPRFDERVRSFVEEASSPFWFIVARTPEYLNWRYADPRAGAFTISVAEEGGRVLGYSVLRLSELRGHIADLLALPGRRDVVASLVRDAHQQFRRSGVSSAESWAAPGHPYREILLEHGFRQKRRSIEFYCQPFHVEDEVVMPFQDPTTPMHIVPGDTDLV